MSGNNTVFICSNPPELCPEKYGIDAGSPTMLDVQGIFHGGDGNQQMTVAQLISCLEREYCDTIAAEYQYLQVSI